MSFDITVMSQWWVFGRMGKTLAKRSFIPGSYPQAGLGDCGGATNGHLL